MKKLFAYIFLFTVTLSAYAQKSKIRVYENPVFNEWEEKPTVYPTPPEFANLEAFVVVNDVHCDFKYEGGITAFYSVHKRIKVLNNRGIERYNKIAIQVPRNSKILSVKARTVLPNGKVHEILKDSLKWTIDETGTWEVDIAMEGVEKNSEIEVLLKEIVDDYAFGSVDFQFDIPVLHTFFQMAYPMECTFEMKGLNGFPTVTDTFIKAKKRKYINIYQPDIPALEREPYSYYGLYGQSAEFRFSYYTEPGSEKKRLNTWDDYAKYLHRMAYTLTDKERTAANKFVSTLGITNKGNDIENIRKIEDGIKNKIVLYSYVDNTKPTDLDSIITYKAATMSGYIKLFAACFTIAGVDHELGMTTDKTERRFDSKFENWEALDYYVFYFPTVKKFLSPAKTYYRFPIVPAYVAGNKGLFCQIPPNGKLTGQISIVRTITSLSASESQRNTDANVTFSKDMEPQVDITYSYSGYHAPDLRNILVLYTGERREDAIKKYIQLADKPEDIVKYSTANESFDNYYTNKPVQISATVKAGHLMEKAGAKYLFKIGEVMTDHAQLYNKKDRVLPVDTYFPDSYDRTITVNIPKGYKILNLQSLRKQADYVNRDGKPVISFSSDYKVTGNKLIVTVKEFYIQTHFPVTEYDRFRTVVNTGSDFNKVVLVMSKI